MAKYATLSDCVDPALTVSGLNLDEADVYVDLALSAIGINANELALITLPNPLLKSIAVAWAKRLAAVEGSLGDNSLLMDKARQYAENAKELKANLSREALGISTANSVGYGTISLGRA